MYYWCTAEHNHRYNKNCKKVRFVLIGQIYTYFLVDLVWFDFGCGFTNFLLYTTNCFVFCFSSHSSVSLMSIKPVAVEVTYISFVSKGRTLFDYPLLFWWKRIFFFTTRLFVCVCPSVFIFFYFWKFKFHLPLLVSWIWFLIFRYGNSRG